MKLTKKNRKWFLTGALVLAFFSVWWFNYYTPLLESIEELKNKKIQLEQSRVRLENRLKTLKEKEEKYRSVAQELKTVSDRIVKGNSLEEINAATQLDFQGFLEKSKIPLKVYTQTRSSKWRNYELGRVQFQLDTNNQGLSDIFEYFENLKQVVRVDKITVAYARKKGNNLHVTINLSTLFVREMNE